MPRGRERHVRVAAQVAALHARLGDAERERDVADRRDVGLGELGGVGLRAEDRLRDDLDERHAGAVVVDERVLGTLDATGRAADVRELAGVLLHVRALDRHLEDPAVGELDLDRALEGDRLVVLRDLVVLREVGVEVVLPGEAARRGDRAAEREPERDRRAHRIAVDDGKRTRQAEAHGGHERVRLGAVEGGVRRVRRRREHLRRGVQLDVHLEPDDRLEQLEGLVVVHQFSAGHQTAPSSVASSSWVLRSGARSRIGPPHSASSSCSSAPPTL